MRVQRKYHLSTLVQGKHHQLKNLVNKSDRFDRLEPRANEAALVTCGGLPGGAAAAGAFLHHHHSLPPPPPPFVFLLLLLLLSS